MLSDDAAVLDILNAARLVQQFVSGLDEDAFREDAKTRSAVLHQLLVIGEAVKRLSAAFRDKHAHVPWRQMAGMRHKLIHGYDEVDLGEVWATIERDIAELVEFMASLAPPEDR